ncbi:hypothetical protein BB558_001333 [Smittium angustum]|uniref:Uncharacterized protein n=1 Tax=Smittium angustum TaxID=133377 RepID=A0A2U1J4P7_SMIAN|nr:hypothetical protein BB558_003925 [Smittium angustum]PWA02542.1 hypothetical protein BB558_001333 [Smittium angustum]
MSWKTAVNTTPKEDTELYVDFVKKFLTDEVIDSVLDRKYTGEDKKMIEEKISADLSSIGLVFDPDNISLNSLRFRAMRIRDFLDKKLRPVCETTDNDWDELSSTLGVEIEPKAGKSEEKDQDKSVAILRPFCLYSVDAEHMYGKKLESLPEDPVTFAKLALGHEIDCSYEDIDDEDQEEWDELENEDAEEGDEELEEIDEKEVENLTAENSKKGKELLDEDLDEDDIEDLDYEELEDEFPYEDDEIASHPAENGFKLLGKHRSKIEAMLKDLTGQDISDFKYYSLPGRHYVVCWLENFGIFGFRLCEPFTDDNEFSDVEEDEE